ncbi:MAG: hypothetical protein HC787_04595 [Nostocaceae cyanobacterium CSU_2_110]|nr:hypothetical protein [Nostocaceae cyanobacterium CSU_2_110]
MTNKRERFPEGDTDRVSFTLKKGVRQRVDNLLPILGSSLSKTLRYLIDLGLDLFDLAQKNGNSIPQAGNLDRMFSTYTSLGVEFIFACESLGLSVPEVGHVGIWFVDNLYPGLDHVEGIQRDTNYQASRVFRLSREIQKLFYQELNLISEEEFTVFLRNLHQETAIALCTAPKGSIATGTLEGSIAQEFVATCEALGVQLPEKGKVREWLQNLVVAQEASNVADRDLASGNSQPFLDYLLTLDAPPTEDEENSIAHQFGLEPAHLKKLISRMKFEENG